MNDADNSLSRPTKRCRASLPPEERKECVSKRRRHSEVASPARKGIRRKTVTATATQVKPPFQPKNRRRREPVSRRKGAVGGNNQSIPNLLDHTEGAAAATDTTPFLTESKTAVQESTISRASLQRLSTGNGHHKCVNCENAKKTPEELIASIPTPCLVFLHQAQNERDRKGINKLNPQARARVVNFLVHCQCKLPHPPSPYTLYVSISCFDRFCGLTLKRGDRDAREKIQRCLSAVAAACLHLASKMEDVWPLDPGDLSLAACGLFTIQDILLWERRICQILDFRITAPTPFDFILQYLARIQLFERARQCRKCYGEDQSVPSFSQVLSKEWKPCQREGRGKSAAEACIIFLLELVLTHPVSTQLTCDVLAAATILAVITVLCGPSADLMIRNLPSEITEAGMSQAANVLTVYREYLSAEEENEKRQRSKCEAIAAAVVPVAPGEDGDDDPSTRSVRARYEAIHLETNLALKRTRMTAYIINRSEALGLNIPPHLARRTSEMILGGSWRATTLSELEPIDVELNHPLGLFGADVVAKHVDAAEFLRPRFKKWAMEYKLDCCTPDKENAQSHDSNVRKCVHHPRRTSTVQFSCFRNLLTVDNCKPLEVCVN